MSKKSNKAKKIIKLLEAIIDTRYQYLKELDYENHKYASKIKEEKYEPVLKELMEILENS